jgi:hypothetical protein
MPLRSVKLATMNESRLRIKLQPSEVPSVNFLREKVSRRLDSESLDPILGMIALCYWVFSPSETRFTVIPLVFVLGSLTLLVKGVFLLRKSSEGLDLSEQELAKLSDPAVRKTLPRLPTQAAQVVQDFGTGALLLWPLLILGKDFDNSWSAPPRFRVFLAGAIIFLLGWVIADSHHLQPRKAVLDQPLRHSTSTTTAFPRNLTVGL